MLNEIQPGDPALVNGERLVTIERLDPETPVGPALVVHDRGVGNFTIWPDAVEHHPVLDGHWLVEASHL